MRLIDGIEGEILKKYRKGKIVDKEDLLYLERMWNTGLMGGSELIAKTTPLGIECTDYSFFEWFNYYLLKIY